MPEKTKLDILVELLRQAPDEVFIQPHNVPDPDAIAASFGLYTLLKQKGLEKLAIVYDQEIEKANALRMLQLFEAPLIPAKEAATLGEEDWAVLVDAQKGNANLTDLPTDEVAAIDHHEYCGNQGYRFEDIRPHVGACSSIIAQYWFENGLTPPRQAATALLYGIFMDTSDLTRGAAALDIDMFYQLYPLSDISAIVELRANEISRGDLDLYAEAFRTVEIYDEIGFLSLKNANDSLLGAAGDIVVSVAGVNIIVAWAEREAGVKLSVRSVTPRARANDLVRALTNGIGVGGGHSHMAGGFIPRASLHPSRPINTLLKHRAISFYEQTLSPSP